ncbi:hypothetical protein F4677DRAFT_404594 [Hypoxylon crocopeplum]|nr:hypothetical protein F4677DRAFT_404594 [Hypoxylon crocopeplum]
MGWTHNAPDNTPTDGPMMVAVAGVLTGVSLCFLFLRAYVRHWLIHAVGLDDWIIVATWLVSCAFTIISAIQTTWGLGMKHVDDIPVENDHTYEILGYVGWPLYILGVLGFKMSLLFSYFRWVHKGMCKYGVTCVLVSCTLFHLSCLIVQLNLCQPVAKIWDPTVVGKCINVNSFYMTSSALTIIFDFCVMFLPFPPLIKTKIPTKKKVTLLGLFALGFFVTVIQIIRIQYLKGLTTAQPNSALLLLWSIVEVHLGIVVACIPVLSPLVKHYQMKSSKRSQESSWGSHTSPSGARRSRKFMKVSIPSSEDDTFDSEKSVIRHVAITKETDILVTKQIAPAHLASHDSMQSGSTRIGAYDFWAEGADMAADNGVSNRGFNAV